MNSRPWRLPATLLATFALAVAAVPAFGDNISNDVVATGNNVVTYAGTDVQTTINFHVDANGGGGAGCDVSSGNQSVYTVSLSNPGGNQTAATVTASAASISFASCTTNYPITFTVKSLGKKVINLVRVSGPTLNANPAGFTLESVAPPANTAPIVTVGGVTNTSYEFGAVPTAVCNVTDAEDTAESATPSLSPITGPLSSYGLGSQTATCSYTDVNNGGGLTDSDSVTYTIIDTTFPVLNTPGGQSLEATGPDGAEASWSISGSDNVALASPASCDVTSPHTFDLGDHTVNCSVTDVAGNTSTGSFKVTVDDSTAPSLVAPGDQTAEATGPSGAIVSYPAATAEDAYDGTLIPTCVPASGSTFALGSTPVSCSVTDSSGNTATAGFTVKVRDTTPPTVTVPADLTLEATGPGGAAASFTVTASDLVDGSTAVDCDHDSGDIFAVGTTTVSCSSTDNAGNTGNASFDVVVQDTTPPAITAHGDVTAEATGADGAHVDYTGPTATDIVDGTVLVGCIPSSGVLVAVDGDQEVTCTATDNAGNTATSHFHLFVVDTTAPTLSVPADIVTGATSAAGAAVSFSASGSDLVDGSVPATCSPASGSTFAPGATTVSCTATDAHSNSSAPKTFTVTVNFAFNGFFAPVDNNGVLNTIKGGQSVPMKWAIPNGSGGWISSLAVVAGVRQIGFSCTSAPTDDIEAPTSGATGLRYDATANQYIYNWQSPKGAGNCYKVTVTLTDGSVKSALFKTK